ncbi:MAG: 2,3-diphosphoglycerate-dependent phosphoglycerate mutase, partial [Alphaproteobacteria bacterium]
MARVVMVRHGQSQWNLENRFTGWWDVGLTEKGEAEARAAGRLLKDKSILP